MCRLRKDSQKTLNLHIRLLLGTETAYNNKKKSINKQQQKIANLEDGQTSDFLSYHILYSSVQFSTKKFTRHTKKQGNTTHLKAKNQATESVPENYLVAYLIGKDFETTERCSNN